jgi:hypothetical protein
MIATILTYPIFFLFIGVLIWAVMKHLHKPRE